MESNKSKRPGVQSPVFQAMRPESSFSGMPELKRIQKKPTKGPRKNHLYFRHYGIKEVLGCRDVLEISKLQQVGVDDRETEINHNDEAPMFDEGKGRSRNLRKSEDNEYKFSSYFTSKFSSCVSFFSPCLIQQASSLPLSF